MVIFKRLEQIKNIKHSVLSIGTFDGIHIGHKQILSEVKNKIHEKKST